VVTDNPEWVLTSADEPVDAGQRHGQMVALDPTHPGVLAWVQDTVETVVDEWGFDYLKLDFLYAAALPGDHHEPATRAAAYRRGLGAIRSAAGADAFLLGCGAPLGPSVGLVDAMRVGPDVEATWDEVASGSQPGMRNAVRNSLHRQFLHRRWWVNDPDCQILRPGIGLTDAEQRSFAAVVALSGGSNVVSDRLADLDDRALSLLRSSLPPVAAGTAEGAGAATIPDRLVCGRADGGAAVAAFNWTDVPRVMSVTPADAGLDAATGWLPGRGQAVDAPVEREVPPHGCLVAHLARPRNRPHVVGARDHLAGGGDLLAATWSADGDEGRLSLALDAPRPLSVVVAVPAGWTPATPLAAADGLRAVEVTPGSRTLRFER
jgi:alpha-galactosidase